MKALIETANEREQRLKGLQPTAEDRKPRAGARSPSCTADCNYLALLLALDRLSLRYCVPNHHPVTNAHCTGTACPVLSARRWADPGFMVARPPPPMGPDCRGQQLKMRPGEHGRLENAALMDDQLVAVVVF